MHGEEAEAAGDMADAGELGDASRLRLVEGELGGWQPDLALEGGARLAELRKVGLEQLLVLVDELVDLAGGDDG